VAGLPPIDRAKAQAELTIDLDALVANWRLLAARVAPARCAAVVKADAYGIGTEQAVRALHRAGCRSFFVAQVSEGVRVRAVTGADAEIYVLNGLIAGVERLQAYVSYELKPVLGSLADLRLWSSSGLGIKTAAALHVDTGMNRLGFGVDELIGLKAMVDTIRVDLLMSHFVSSEVANDPLNDAQIKKFERARAAFPALAGSMSNSSALFLPQKPFYDLARPGYALYGGNPTPGARNPMQPVVSLRTPVLQVREIAPGETVGYNAQWTAKRKTRLATIGIGYADGLPRNLMATQTRPGGEAMVNDHRCSFAGRVSMDLTVIDVTDAGEVKPGTMVELMGAKITVDDVGERAGTIGYEVLTNLSRRYHRIYKGG